MSGAPEITDEKSLKAWLDALPRDTPERLADAERIVAGIAWRAGMRVLPRYVSAALMVLGDEQGVTLLAILRELLASGVYAASPKSETRVAASAASMSASFERLFSGNTGEAADAAVAFEAAARVEPERAAQYSSFAETHDVLDHASQLLPWKAVSRDCLKLTSGNSFDSLPLWPEIKNPLQSYWRETAQDLSALGACSIPDDHIDPRRTALFMARSILREVRDGGRTC